jgi:glycosyltransferase 2 family protein
LSSQAAPPIEPSLPDAQELEASRRGRRQRNVRATVASVVLIATFVWLLARGGFPLVPSRQDLSRVDSSYLVAFCGLMIANMLTRFARHHFLIAPLAKVAFRKIMTINAIGMALITFLPLRIGEMARPAMLREKGHLSAWAVTGTVGAERILDGLVFSGMLLLGLGMATPQDPLPDHVGDLPVPVWVIPRSATIASLVFASAFVVMCAFYFYRVVARRLTERVVGVFSPRFAHKLADIVERLSDGLRFLTDFRHSVPYLAVTLFSVGCNVLAIDALAQAVGLSELTFAQSLVVLGVLALGFSAPNAPGFFGMVQLALYAGLACYIAPDKVAREGSVFVFLYYVGYLLTVSALAGLALVIDAFIAARPQPHDPHGADQVV